MKKKPQQLYYDPNRIEVEVKHSNSHTDFVMNLNGDHLKDLKDTMVECYFENEHGHCIIRIPNNPQILKRIKESI